MADDHGGRRLGQRGRQWGTSRGIFRAPESRNAASCGISVPPSNPSDPIYTPQDVCHKMPAGQRQHHCTARFLYCSPGEAARGVQQHLVGPSTPVFGAQLMGGDSRRDQPLLAAAIAEQFRAGYPDDPPACAPGRAFTPATALRRELICTRNQAESALHRDSYSPASVEDGSGL